MAERSTQVELAAVGLSLDDRDLRLKQFDCRIDGPRRVESVEIQTMTNGTGINGENKENEECSKTVKVSFILTNIFENRSENSSKVLLKMFHQSENHYFCCSEGFLLCVCITDFTDCHSRICAPQLVVVGSID